MRKPKPRKVGKRKQKPQEIYKCVVCGDELPLGTPEPKCCYYCEIDTAVMATLGF